MFILLIIHHLKISYLIQFMFVFMLSAWSVDSHFSWKSHLINICVFNKPYASQAHQNHIISVPDISEICESIRMNR